MTPLKKIEKGNDLSQRQHDSLKNRKGKYNPNVIEAKWQNIGQKIKHLPLQTTLKTKALCVRYVSLSIRGRPSRGTSFRVYCF
jgi:hypothetical protein